MELIPIVTGLMREGDDIIAKLNELKENDIVVVSSKAVATCEGRIVNLKSLTVTKEAKRYSALCGRSPEFCQAALEETRARNGVIVGTCPGAMVTEVRPKVPSLPRRPKVPSLPRRPWHGETHGTILTANAGLDESNIQKGFAIGWPEDPVKSARAIRRKIQERIQHGLLVCWFAGLLDTCKVLFGIPSYPESRKRKNKQTRKPSCAVIISDSCVRPQRWGVTAFALTVSGIDPIQDQAGKKDLFGKPLRITKEAVADQLATAANMLMGNAGQGVPAVIVRNHGFALSDFEGWVPGIEPEEDLFRGIV